MSESRAEPADAHEGAPVAADQEAPAAAAPEPRVSAVVPSADAGSFGLRSVPMLALFSVAGTLCVSAIVPAMHGWVVGISGAVDVADRLAETASQALVFFLLFGIGAVTVDLMKSRAPIPLRAAALFLAMLVSFGAVATIGIDRMPIALHAVVGLCASVAAITFGLDAILRDRSVAGGVPVAIGLASLSRGFGAFFAERASAVRKDIESIRSAFELARSLGTVAAALVVVACVAAIVHLLRVERRRGMIAAAAAVLAAFALAWCATAPLDAEEGALFVLLRRTGQELLSLPTPRLPPFADAFVAVLPPVLAALALGVGRSQRIVAAGIALALVAGASAEVPILALSLTLGAVALSVDRRDPHGLAAILSSGR